MTISEDLKVVINAHPPMSWDEARTHINGTNPVWLLSIGCDITAANLLALWLWGMLQQEEEINASDLLGINVFDIFTRNLARIPTELNREFLLTKAAVAKQVASFSGEGPIRFFKQALESTPEGRDIYGRANFKELPHPWNYSVKMMPPGWDTPTDLLKFETSVLRVSRSSQLDDRNTALIAIYKPLGITSYIINQLHEQLIGRYGMANYVQSKMSEIFPLVEERTLSEPQPRDNWLSDFQAELLSEVDVIVHLDRSDVSYRAFEILRDAGIDFRVVLSSSSDVPYAEWGDVRYEGLDGIEWLAGLLVGLERVAVESVREVMPGILESGDQRLKDWMKQIHARHLEDAQAALGLINR